MINKSETVYETKCEKVFKINPNSLIQKYKETTMCGKI